MVYLHPINGSRLSPFGITRDEPPGMEYALAQRSKTVNKPEYAE
jgi:hypothetical protein